MNITQLIADLKIAERVKDKPYVIYPYGRAGKELKRVLNEEYVLRELAVIDINADAKSGVSSIDFFDTIDLENTIVIITSDNLEVYDDVRNFIRSKFRFENVIDIAGPVNTQIDCRIESLRLCADVLNSNNINGAVAEAGVFEGDFAKYMNLFFRNRKLYLFDTFEGFATEKLKQNVDECWNKWMEDNYSFVSSGIESVRSKMYFPEKCIFKKGFFPESAEGLDETFCFVNLDMDIYQSTKDGLEFFWPKMEKRGVIFVHDYISWNCPGVKKAVDEFCEINNVGVISLPDVNGTAVLIK